MKAAKASRKLPFLLLVLAILIIVVAKFSLLSDGRARLSDHLYDIAEFPEERAGCPTNARNTIAYTARDNGTLSLYSINTDGTDRKLLYRNTDRLNPNILTPLATSCRSLQFTAMKDGVWRMYSIDTDGTNVRLLGNGPADLYVTPQSRDKNLIVADETKAKSRYALYYLHDGGKTELYAAPLSDCRWGNSGECPPEDYINGAAISPDKTRVAFTAIIQNKTYIMVVNLDGSGMRRLTEGDEFDWIN